MANPSPKVALIPNVPERGSTIGIRVSDPAGGSPGGVRSRRCAVPEPAGPADERGAPDFGENRPARRFSGAETAGSGL